MESKVRSHSVYSYFDIKNFGFVNIKASICSDAPAVVVSCTDLSGIINYVEEKRKVAEVQLKFGIDGGESFLKRCLSVQSSKESDHFWPVRQKYPFKWCDSQKGKLDAGGMLKTIGNNSQKFRDWCKAEALDNQTTTFFKLCSRANFYRRR